jgi:hypothetical protein
MKIGELRKGQGRIPASMRNSLENFARKTEVIVDSFAEPLEAVPPPTLIFHYTNDTGLRGIIETGKLWLTDIFNLNDPSELRHGCNPATEFLIAEENDKRPEIKQFASNLSAMLQGGIEEVGHFFVLSFSEAGDDLGQWRAYADNGRGYALGFDARALEDIYAKGGPGNMTFPVSYDESELRQMHRQIIDEVYPLISMPRGRNLRGEAVNEYMSELLRSLSVPIIRAALFFKHKAYSNEQEYRFLKLFMAGSVIPDLQYRSRSHSLVRYLEFDWRSLVPDSLRKIVLGPAADRDKAPRFVNDCLRAFHVGAVEISHSEIPYRAV